MKKCPPPPLLFQSAELQAAAAKREAELEGELSTAREALAASQARLEALQEELADACDLDRTYVGGIERGERNPSLVNIWRLAAALEISTGALFALVEKEFARD